MLATAGLAASAGLIHLLAARWHAEHGLILAFFVLAGIAQLAWAAMAARGSSVELALLGAAGNGGLALIWLISRLRGLPVDGARTAEAAGVADIAATCFEVAIVLAVIWLVRFPEARRRRLARATVARPLLTAMSALAVVALAAAILPAGHAHDHDHLADTSVPVAVGRTGAGSAAGEPAHDHASHDHAAASAAGGVSGEDDPVPSTTPRRLSGPASAPPSAAVARPSSPGDDVVEVRHGPLVVTPEELAGPDQADNKILTALQPPCEDCYLTGLWPDLVFEDGRSANFADEMMLHHAVWLVPGQRDRTCGPQTTIGSRGKRVFASGNERTPVQMPPGFGLHVPAGQRWDMLVHVMNLGHAPQTVYVSIRATWRPAAEGTMKPVEPVWLGINNCQSSEYAAPAGRSDRTMRWHSTITGRIVASGGHVHDGGVKTVLTNTTTGERICTSVAGYGRDPAYLGHIESMSTCTGDRIGRVRFGEAIELRAFYDASEPVPDAMGIVLSYVYETDDIDGGRPVADDPPPDAKPPPIEQHHSH